MVGRGIANPMFERTRGFKSPSPRFDSICLFLAGPLCTGACSISNYIVMNSKQLVLCSMDLVITP